MSNKRTLELKLIARDMLSDVVKGVERSVEGLGDKIKAAGTKAAGGWPTVAQGINQIHDGFNTLRDTAGMALGALENGWNALIVPAMEAQRIMAQTENVIRSTGGAAGMTAGEVNALADRMERLSGVDANVVQAGENMLLTFTNIGEDVFPTATETMLDMAVAMNNGSAAGIDLNSTAIQLGKALNDPLKGVSALAEVGVTFTQEQRDQIKAMMEVNDVAGAQAVILNELAREFGGAAEAAGDSAEGKFNKMARAIEGMAEAIGEKLLPVLDSAADTMIVLTTGTDQLADAFHASQQTIYNDLLANKMSLDDYNNAVIGMAANVSLWNAEVGETLRTQSLMTAEQVQAAQAAREQEAALKAQEAAQRAANAERMGSIDGLRAYYEGMRQANDVIANTAEAERKAAEAKRALAAAAGEMIAKNVSLAQSFKDVTDAQAKQMLAQAQIDTLKKKYDDNRLSEEALSQATNELLLRYDLATPKSLAMAEAQQLVNRAFLDGDLPMREFITSSEKIPGIAQDGKITLEELTSLGIKPTTLAAGEQKGVVDDLKAAWMGVPKTWKTKYTIETEGEIPGGGGGRSSGMALGGVARAGLPIWIGEHGAEPFLPAVDGRVLSRRDAMDALARSGGSNAPVINVSIAATLANQMDVEDLAWRVSEVVGERLKSYA